MAQENWQKIKLLKLHELLQRETDEQHPLTTSRICSRMKEIGIPCDRRTLSKDVELLNEHGIEVLTVWVGKEKGYYIEDRRFSVPELKILIDAVQAASFITPKKTRELIAKIAELGGDNRADILQSNLVSFNTRKHSNEKIYYNVDALEEALHQQKKVKFLYFDLDVKGEKVFRRDGHHYVADPVALVFNEDNYYLVAYSAKHDGTANYRVDRMEAVELLEEAISKKAVELRGEVSEYTERAIKMYGGQERSVELAFDKALIGAVFDRFGEGTEMRRLGENWCAARVEVQVSPTFWGWMFQFGEKMRVLEPVEVAEEYREWGRRVVEK